MKTLNLSSLDWVSARTSAATSALMSVMLLSGCAVPFPTYSISSDHITVIRNAQKQVELGKFVGLQKTVSCRLQPIGPDGGLTFAEYIRNSFKDEVVISGQKAGVGASRIAVELTNVDLDCGMATGYWTIDAQVSINDRPPFSVHTSRSFDGNFLGQVVKERAMGAFVPAVQMFIGDIMASQEYKNQFAGR